MAGYSIRPLAPGDYDEAFALWSRTEGMGLGASDTREAIAFFLERNPGLSQAALDEHGRLVGALLCGHDGRRGYLHHLAVDLAHRRHGLGGQLVARCVEKLTALGLEKCNLFLLAENETGRTFWQHQGWLFRDNVVLVQQVLRPGSRSCCQSC